MAKKSKQFAFSIIELLVVITIIASLTGLAIPAIRMMQQSYNSTGTEQMISSALSSARSIAMSNQRYAGVRFQKAYNPQYPNDPLKQDQYMIFIVEDHENTRWVCGFSVVDGCKPIKLPEKISVMDKIKRDHSSSPKNCGSDIPKDPIDDFMNNIQITDTSTFSILFSPAGKLVIHRVRCDYKSNNDDIFNTESELEQDPPVGMFMIDEDDNDSKGFGVENSRSSFVIYDRDKFNKIDENNDRWEYIENLETIYINAYTGSIIER